ncbi:hypothetical protein FQR65_LT19584 [Abscondita terminalis]|nr:hypothetical protein FQR65_LT19584 [Abscondita terminalis]
MEADSNAASLLSNLGISEDFHYTLMGDMEGNFKVVYSLAQSAIWNYTSGNESSSLAAKQRAQQQESRKKKAEPGRIYSRFSAKMLPNRKQATSRKFDNLEAVTNEVKLMMDPNADPFAAPAPDAAEAPSKFGASDVQDLNWVQLLNAYSCTECGRCTASCPANITGKKLSPRLIMMKTKRSP